MPKLHETLHKQTEPGSGADKASAPLPEKWKRKERSRKPGRQELQKFDKLVDLFPGGGPAGDKAHGGVVRIGLVPETHLDFLG